MSLFLVSWAKSRIWDKIWQKTNSVYLALEAIKNVEKCMRNFSWPQKINQAKMRSKHEAPVKPRSKQFHWCANTQKYSLYEIIIMDFATAPTKPNKKGHYKRFTKSGFLATKTIFCILQHGVLDLWWIQDGIHMDT